MFDVTEHFKQRCAERGVSKGEIDLIISAVSGGTSSPVTRAGNCRDFHRVVLPSGVEYYVLINPVLKRLITIYTRAMFYSHPDLAYDGSRLLLSMTAVQSARRLGISNDILLTGVRAVLLAMNGDESAAEYVCKDRTGKSGFWRVKFDMGSIYYLIGDRNTVITINDQKMFSAKRSVRKRQC